MRKLLFVVVALVSGVVLSSCALWPFGPGDQILDDDHQQADARMEQIAAAVSTEDAAALKGLFSSRALDGATELDEGVDYLLTLVPNGGLAWEREGVDSSGRILDGKQTEVLWSYYDVSVDGEDFRLFFADFTVNTIDPENAGLYALGIIPSPESWDSDEAKAFVAWESSFDVDGNGVPGIYIPTS